jgi:hypothetical protein
MFIETSRAVLGAAALLTCLVCRDAIACGGGYRRVLDWDPSVDLAAYSYTSAVEVGTSPGGEESVRGGEGNLFEVRRISTGATLANFDCRAEYPSLSREDGGRLRSCKWDLIRKSGPFAQIREGRRGDDARARLTLKGGELSFLMLTGDKVMLLRLRPGAPSVLAASMDGDYVYLVTLSVDTECSDHTETLLKLPRPDGHTTMQERQQMYLAEAMQVADHADLDSGTFMEQVRSYGMVDERMVRSVFCANPPPSRPEYSWRTISRAFDKRERRRLTTVLTRAGCLTRR